MKGKRVNRFSALTVCIGICMIGVAIFSWQCASQQIHDYLICGLRKEQLPPPGQKIDLIYILGGNETSLLFKLDEAKTYYQGQTAPRLWALSREGITAYSPAFKRNLTRDEWLMNQLKIHGISGSYVKLVTTADGFFNTFEEAKAVARRVLAEKIQSILIITQVHHTTRAFRSFHHFLKNSRVSIFVQDTKEPIGIADLLLEYVKLLVYWFALF